MVSHQIYTVMAVAAREKWEDCETADIGKHGRTSADLQLNKQEEETHYTALALKCIPLLNIIIKEFEHKHTKLFF